MALSAPTHLICFAHRGASGYEPENTLKSFSKALELGAPWIEFDVRAVEDELVVFHDRTLPRLTGASGSVHKQSLAYLRTLKVKGTEQIPLLSEVLANQRVAISLRYSPRVGVPILSLSLHSTMKSSQRLSVSALWFRLAYSCTAIL